MNSLNNSGIDAKQKTKIKLLKKVNESLLDISSIEGGIVFNKIKTILKITDKQQEPSLWLINFPKIILEMFFLKKSLKYVIDESYEVTTTHIISELLDLAKKIEKISDITKAKMILGIKKNIDVLIHLQKKYNLVPVNEILNSIVTFKINKKKNNNLTVLKNTLNKFSVTNVSSDVPIITIESIENFFMKHPISEDTLKDIESEKIKRNENIARKNKEVADKFAKIEAEEAFFKKKFMINPEVNSSHLSNSSHS